MGSKLIELFGQIADLKDVDCKNTLAIATLIELLIDKGLFTRGEFAAKAREIDRASVLEIVLARRAQLAAGK